MNGFYKKKKTEDNDDKEVECIECGVKNCKVCSQDKDDVSEFVKCRYCEEGYGLVNN